MAEVCNVGNMSTKRPNDQGQSSGPPAKKAMIQFEPAKIGPVYSLVNVQQSILAVNEPLPSDKGFARLILNVDMNFERFVPVDKYKLPIYRRIWT